jgi:hypothetical protein
MESQTPERSVRDLMDEYGLVRYADYIQRCTDFRSQALNESLS